MMERTLVLVDTSYLLASFYNAWEEGARGQLEISLATVVQRLDKVSRGLVDQPVQRQNWYDGIPDSGPHRYQRTLRVIEGVQLRAGQLIEWGERRTQKAVDTLLVADMILAAVRGQVTDMVLVSGDADMVPGVRVAVDAGVRVHLVGFGFDSMSSALRHACDTTTVLDPREDFEDAMQLRVLEGPVPPRVPVSTPRPAVPGEEGADAGAVDPAAMVDPDAREADGGTDEPVVPPLTIGDEERAEEEADDPGPQGGAEGAEAPGPGPAGPSGQGHDDESPAGGTSGDGGTSGETPADGAEDGGDATSAEASSEDSAPSRPTPSMMAPRRRPLRSKYVPLSEEVWTSSGEVTPFDVGQQYASWWYEQAASPEQRSGAHLLSGGVLPPAVDRPLLQFACQMLNEFTLTEAQRVRLRDGFHEGIRAVLAGR